MSEENETQKHTETSTKVENKPGDILKQVAGTDKAHPDFNKIQEDRKKAIDGFKQMFLHKYDLEKVNLEEELEKVKSKTSNLSRRQRDAVLAYFQIFKEVIEEQKSKEVETNRKPIVPNDGMKPVEEAPKEEPSGVETHTEE